jgi:hypothetical protein
MLVNSVSLNSVFCWSLHVPHYIVLCTVCHRYLIFYFSCAGRTMNCSDVNDWISCNCLCDLKIFAVFIELGTQWKVVFRTVDIFAVCALHCVSSCLLLFYFFLYRKDSELFWWWWLNFLWLRLWLATRAELRKMDDRKKSLIFSKKRLLVVNHYRSL